MQPSEEFEQNSFDRIQCALDIVHTIDELEDPLQSRSSTPKDTALRILEAACKFYDADWCGLIQVDLDLRLWTPFWWHNTGVEDKTTILTEEFESADFLDRWVLAIRKNLPMVVPDTTVVKDSHPTEYNLYQRLSIKSVMAVSLEPRPIALLAVRNPKRYLHQTSMLRVLAYVLLASYNEQKMLNRLQMVCIPTTIKNNTDIYISLFGQLQISTSSGTLKESDYNSPRISQLLTYLLISNEKAHSSLEIAQALWPDDSTNPDQKYEEFDLSPSATFGLISDAELIVSTASGYQFNPKIHIIADYQQFDEFIRSASAASSIINRVELLKSAIDLYNGKILSSAEGEHWLIQFATKYHIAYIGAVNELLKQLASLHSYDLLNQYAMRSLTIAPENTKGYYWLIRSLKAQGMDELASNEYRLAKQKLTDNEYLDLLDLLANNQE